MLGLFTYFPSKSQHLLIYASNIIIAFISFGKKTLHWYSFQLTIVHIYVHKLDQHKFNLLLIKMPK